MNFSMGRCRLEFTQALSSVALAWHKARGSTPFGVTIERQTDRQTDLSVGRSANRETERQRDRDRQRDNREAELNDKRRTKAYYSHGLLLQTSAEMIKHHVRGEHHNKEEHHIKEEHHVEETSENECERVGTCGSERERVRESANERERARASPSE